jgi:osmotically inducible protein OsmC
LGIIYKQRGELKMADIERTVEAVWNGTLREGNGTLSTPSGTLKETSYTFISRFENGAGTNPEELLAAAHAGCFTMALGAALGRKDGVTVEQIKTTETVVLGLVDGGRKITLLKLETVGKVSGVDQATFAAVAEETKKGCIISQALSAVPMEIHAKLA